MLKSFNKSRKRSLALPRDSKNAGALLEPLRFTLCVEKKLFIALIIISIVGFIGLAYISLKERSENKQIYYFLISTVVCFLTISFLGLVFPIFWALFTGFCGMFATQALKPKPDSRFGHYINRGIMAGLWLAIPVIIYVYLYT